jgi:hypothetical protein
MLEFIILIQLFDLVFEGYDFWSGMLLYECVPFVWCNIPKPIQRCKTTLHILLVESVCESLKSIRYCFNRSIFAKLLLL